jgi:antitoxin VapB
MAAMRGGATATRKLARLFANGRSQAVRLPREFRFPGTQVRVSRHGRGVLIEPVVSDVDEWFAELDRYAGEPFMPEGRRQPPADERAPLDA